MIINNDIQLLYKIKKGGQINANECEKVNIALSTINIDEIPEDQRENVKEYLINALNMKSVKAGIIKDLDKLLEFL